MQYELSYYIGKYRRPVTITLVALVVLLVGVVTYHSYHTAEQRRGKIAVAVEVVPRDATVTLSNGEIIPSRGDAYIAPGDYTVTVQKDGFRTQIRDLRVNREAVPYIYVGLAGKSQEARDWQSRHASDYQRLEYLTIERNRQYNTQFKSTNPIVRDLPIKDPYYTVDYRNHDDASIELIVWGTSPRARAAALDMLRKKGYDPTDYRVIYEGFTNPLQEAGRE